MNRQQALDRLHFDNESFFYDEVESMTMLKQEALVQEALVDDGQYALPFDAQAPKSKLVSEALLVHRLEQPGPNMPMHFDARRDELIRTILKSSRLPACSLPLVGARSARVAANRRVEGLFDVGLASPAASTCCLKTASSFALPLTHPLNHRNPCVEVL